MEFINVIVAGAAAWALGAVWYMLVGTRWMQASGLTEEDVNRRDPIPFVVSFIGAVIVAGMLRYILVASGADSIGKGLISGAGIGAFVVVPWMVNNVLYGQRDKQLIWIDGVYPIGGMALMGAVLNLF